MQARGKCDAALEAAVRNLQPQDIGAPSLAGEGTGAGDHQGLAFDLDTHGLRRHAGKRGDDQKPRFGFEHIDGRFPARGLRPLARWLKELAMKLLGLLEHGAGLGPHLTFWVTHYTILTEQPANLSDWAVTCQMTRSSEGRVYIGCASRSDKGLSLAPV